MAGAPLVENGVYVYYFEFQFESNGRRKRQRRRLSTHIFPASWRPTEYPRCGRKIRTADVDIPDCIVHARNVAYRAERFGESWFDEQMSVRAPVWSDARFVNSMDFG